MDIKKNSIKLLKRKINVKKDTNFINGKDSIINVTKKI